MKEGKTEPENKLIEIMDSTLRDGEQMQDGSYTSAEKQTIAKLLLEEVGVNRVEIASAMVSRGEEEAVREVIQWAKESGYLDKIEVLGLTDGTVSVDWISRKFTAPTITISIIISTITTTELIKKTGGNVRKPYIPLSRKSQM